MPPSIDPSAKDGVVMKSAAEYPMILTVDDAAALARVSPKTIYELVHAEGFPAVHFGRAIRIPRDSFLRWLENQASA